MVSPNRLETEQLLAAVRRGHTDSLGMLLEQYRDYLYLIARARIGVRLQARANASDVVQETFLLASRHFDQFASATNRVRLARRSASRPAKRASSGRTKTAPNASRPVDLGGGRARKGCRIS